MQGIEADDGEEQEREPGDGDFTFFAVSSGGGVPPRQDDAQDDQHRGQHHHADHLDDDGRVGDGLPHGVAGAHHVGHFMKGGSGKEAHLFRRQVQHSGPVQGRIQEHG